MKQEVASFLNYVAASPTVFQATQQACDMLDAAGFTRLSEHKAWEMLPGGRYYVTRNRSALVAFAVPENGFTHCQIVASHGDSPTFKLKAHAEGEAAGAYIRLDVEPYGGMIMSTWFDRPLSIAGRALVREDGRLVTRLIDLDRDAALIPNMPIHFNRDINSGYSYNPQTDMLPLFGGKDAKGALAAEIAAKAGAKEEDVVACDLFLYNRTPASVWGANEEFLSCPRIDDLECAYTSLAAFIAAPAAGHVNVCAVFDNEEVGSLSKQGADSTLLGDVLTRALCALGLSDAQIRAALAASFMVSADNAHAVHPNHPEKYDDLNRTVSGAYSIPEPVGDEPEAADETALILMPGLAFDPAGHRCGYGGGFYDKYLAAHKNHPTIALCYGFQMYDHLDVDEFDIPVDAVIAAEEDAE